MRRQTGSTVAMARRDDEGFSPLSLVGPVVGAVGAITNTIVKFTPPSVSRGLVEWGVKGALALLVFSFARSVISLVLTIGLVVGGLFIAGKVLGGGEDLQDDGGW